MNVLVTGGAGYIGSHTVHALLRRGHQVVVADDLSTGHREFVPLESSFHAMSIANTSALAEIMHSARIDAVIHFAAKSLVGEDGRCPVSYLGANVGGTLSLMNAMVRAGVNRIVFSSSCVVYGSPTVDFIDENQPTNPISLYGESKLAMESIIRAFAGRYGMTYAAMRYFNAAGAASSVTIGEWHMPETHLIPRALQAALGAPDADKEIRIFGDDFDTPDGTPIRDYIHVEDLAEAHVLALGARESSTMNLGTGSGQSVHEIIRLIETEIGLPVPRSVGARRTGDPPRLVASHGKAEKLLNWKPERGIKEIIQSAAAWERERVRRIKSRS